MVLDEWELENLRSEVSDLESERDELHTLVLEARELLIEALQRDEDHPAWQFSVDRWLHRTPR